jgi:hypothetical protein
MTTGEMAKSRSMTAASSRRPGNRWRTRTTPQAIPNTVLRGTAMAATSSVSQHPDLALGVGHEPGLLVRNLLFTSDQPPGSLRKQADRSVECPNRPTTPG